jgi:uncharacterized protein YeaO (DUF488 family)
MPVKVGCASDYNKNHPDRIRKKRDEETVVLVANKRFGWVDCDEHITELAPRLATHDEWKNSRKTPYDWKKFSSKYTAEMKSAKSCKAIRNLGERSKNREIIRLVCYEKDDNPYCQSERLHHFPAVRTSEDYRVCEVHSKDDSTKIN